MFEEYNATMKQLKITGGAMNEFYHQQLKEISTGRIGTGYLYGGTLGAV